MPTVLLVNGFRFFFYMNEHAPAHVHVTKGGGNAKVTLIPEIELTYADGFKVRDIKEIIAITKTNYALLIQKWYETFSK